MPNQAAAQCALGAALRELRQERGLSQEALAAEAGLHRTYVSQTERGQRNLSLMNLIRLAEALDVDAAQLLGRARL